MYFVLCDLFLFHLPLSVFYILNKPVNFHLVISFNCIFVHCFLYFFLYSSLLSYRSLSAINDTCLFLLLHIFLYYYSMIHIHSFFHQVHRRAAFNNLVRLLKNTAYHLALYQVSINMVTELIHHQDL